MPEVCIFRRLSVYPSFPRFQTMPHGRADETNEDIIDGVEKCVIVIALHFDSSKILAEYKFRYFFRAEVALVGL